EVAIVHAVNFVCFAVLCGAFEYFYIASLRLARRQRLAVLSLPGGGVAGYALFACAALTMTPLELTTPDFLSNAAILAALGAMLRLVDRDRKAGIGTALILGAALGLGAL